MEVVTAGAIGRAKLQSNYRHRQTNTKSFLQAGCPSCRPTNSVKALKGEPTGNVWFAHKLSDAVDQSRCRRMMRENCSDRSSDSDTTFLLSFSSIAQTHLINKTKQTPSTALKCKLTRVSRHQKSNRLRRYIGFVLTYLLTYNSYSALGITICYVWNQAVWWSRRVGWDGLDMLNIKTIPTGSSIVWHWRLKELDRVRKLKD